MISNGEIDSDSLRKLIEFLESFGRPHFIHAGFALHLKGFSSELDDIDVKIYHENLNEVFSSAKKFFGEDRVEMIKAKKYSRGSYLFPDGIAIRLKTPVDICTRTGAINDLGKVEFPYDSDIFKNVEYVEYDKIKIPLPSLEYLFLYYLVLRRDSRDGKDDNGKIVEILNSHKFIEKNLFNLINKIPERKNIIDIYNSYLKLCSSVVPGGA